MNKHDHTVFHNLMHRASSFHAARSVPLTDEHKRLYLEAYSKDIGGTVRFFNDPKECEEKYQEFKKNTSTALRQTITDTSFVGKSVCKCGMEKDTKAKVCIGCYSEFKKTVSLNSGKSIIEQLLSSGESYSAIGRRYGVCVATIKNWLSE